MFCNTKHTYVNKNKCILFCNKTNFSTLAWFYSNTGVLNDYLMKYTTTKHGDARTHARTHTRTHARTHASMHARMYREAICTHVYYTCFQNQVKVLSLPPPKKPLTKLLTICYGPSQTRGIPGLHDATPLWGHKAKWGGGGGEGFLVVFRWS